MIASGTTPTAKGTSSRGSGFSGSARHSSTHAHPLVEKALHVKISVGISAGLVMVVICFMVYCVIKNCRKIKALLRTAVTRDENIALFPNTETATGTSCNESVRQNHQTPEIERQNGGR